MKEVSTNGKQEELAPTLTQVLHHWNEVSTDLKLETAVTVTVPIGEKVFIAKISTKSSQFQINSKLMKRHLARQRFNADRNAGRTKKFGDLPRLNQFEYEEPNIPQQRKLLNPPIRVQ
jgi:hypothetical protein